MTARIQSIYWGKRWCMGYTVTGITLPSISSWWADDNALEDRTRIAMNPPSKVCNTKASRPGFATNLWCCIHFLNSPFDILPSSSFPCVLSTAASYHRSKADLKYLERTLSCSSDSKLSWRIYPRPIKPSINESNRLRTIKPAQMTKTVEE